MRQARIRKETAKAPALKVLEPKLDMDYHRQNVEAILRRHQSLDSARELLGLVIVASTPGGIRKVMISKTRSFDGIGKSTQNPQGIEQEAGRFYIMRFRSARFLNITTGRQGDAKCVWIEKGVDLESGKALKSNKLIDFLGLKDGKPVFSPTTAIVPGETTCEARRLKLEGASENTTAIFEAVFK